MSRRLRFVSSRGNYVRGGIAIGTGVNPTLVPASEISPDALRKIASDPNVEVAVEIEEDRFVRLARAELDLAVEAGLRLTGERADVATGGAIPGGATGPIDIVSRTGEALMPTLEELIQSLDLGRPFVAPADDTSGEHPQFEGSDGPRAPLEPPVELTPPAPPADLTPPEPPVDLTPPAPPVDLTPPAPPADLTPPPAPAPRKTRRQPHDPQ